MGFSALIQRLAFRFQRLVLVFLLLASCFLLLATIKSANAQTADAESVSNNYSQSQSGYLTPNTNSDVPKNLGTWTQNVMIEVMQAMVCQIGGTLASQNSSIQCLGVDPETGKIGSIKDGQGAIGVMTHFIAVLYTPPAHFSDYTRYLAQNFGLAKPAIAATGIDSISTLGKTWTVFRNFVYILFVIVFVVIGVAIMLRVRIDPRTVMSIQNQIPKLIVGLVLVTFSFAIAGLLIDLMWVSIYILINTFALADPAISAGGVTAKLNSNPLTFAGATLQNLGGVIGGSAGAIANIVKEIFFTSGVPAAPNSGFTDLIGNFVQTLVSGILGGLFAAIAGILALIIIFIALLWALIRLWFTLLLAYINILIDILIAPFWIVAGLFPGAGPKVGFGAWFRDILANLAAFPAVIGMFLLGKILIDNFTYTEAVNDVDSFIPPLIGNPSSTSSIVSLISLGIILATPAVVKMTKEAFKATGISYGPIGQSLGAGQAFVGGVGGAIWSRMYYRDPRSGQTYGPAADIGRGALRRAGETRPIQAVRNSRVFNNRVTGVLGNLRSRGRGGGGGQGGGTPPPTPPLQTPPAGPPPAGNGPQAGAQRPNYPVNEDAQNQPFMG